MSIIIKGMDMPKYGDTFKVYLDAADNLLLVDTSDSSRFYTLVEAKAPHGRLKDVDELSVDLCCYSDYDGGSTEYGYSHEMVDNAPTIIEAEEKDNG